MTRFFVRLLKGQRSSSLHYASCFGRPNIVRVLLRNGANVDLRDDEGKTALDKARERNDEGHREVVNILLQSPAEWMSNSLSDSESLSSSKDNRKKRNKDKDSNADSKSINTEEIDPTIIAINEPKLVNDYIKKLLPIFCSTFQSSMIRQVKKSSLNIIRKIVFYMSREQLIDLNAESKSLCSQQQIVEVISSCLDSEEEDEDCCLLALQMIQDLMDKDFNLFLDHFARLGVFNKVQSISGINELNNNSETSKNNNTSISNKKSIYSSKEEDDQLNANESEGFTEDCKEILVGRPYHWRDWSIVRSKDCLYLWNDSVILELSNGSNGWFRFILDNKLSTMYSSGSPESNSTESSTEDRNELFDKLQKAKSQVSSSMSSQSILSSNSTASHTIGNWNLKAYVFFTVL